MINNKQNKDLQNLVFNPSDKNLNIIDEDFINSLKEENEDLDFTKIIL